MPLDKRYSIPNEWQNRVLDALAGTFQSSNTPGIDRFGRSRVSLPFTIFDSKQLADKREFFWIDEETTGSGTSSTYNANTSSTTLAVSAATAGRRVRQTRQRHNYQPGKSQRNTFTGVLGAGDPSVTLRSYVTGSAVDTPITRDEWNIDKLDGTGISGARVDFTKAQIMVIEFEWLGVGDVWFGFFSGGALYYCHVLKNANELEDVYMTTPNLPIRYEIESDGTTVTKKAGVFDDKNGLFFSVTNTTAEVDSIKHVCTTVQSEGGQELTGITRYVGTGGTELSTTTADLVYLATAIRLKSTHIDNLVKPFKIAMFSETNDNFEWKLIYNPTVAGTLTWTPIANSAVEYANGVTANTVTGGTDLDGGWSASSAAAAADLSNILSIGTALDGTSDVIALCVRPISTNANIQASQTWIELA